MEDKQIIDLYFSRDEQAISETSKKYSSFLNIHLSIKPAFNPIEEIDKCLTDSVKQTE